MPPTLRTGLAARLDYLVPEGRTAPHLLPESAEFAALPATGYLVGLVEWACLGALASHLDEDERTVGVHVDLSHEAPTPPGCGVTIEVELIAFDGRWHAGRPRRAGQDLGRSVISGQRGCTWLESLV